MCETAKVNLLFEDWKNLGTYEHLNVELFEIISDRPYLREFILVTQVTKSGDEDPFINRKIVLDEYWNASAIRAAIKALDDLEREIIKSYTAED